MLSNTNEDVTMDNQQGSKIIKKRWTEQEINFIKENYKQNTTKELAAILDRDYSSTKRKLKEYVYDLQNEDNLLEGFEIIPYSTIHCVNKEGKVLSVKTRKEIKPSFNKKGYLQVCLEGKRTKTIHRIVAEVFIENPNNYKTVNHIDGNKLNNSVDNLEWCTIEYNVKHAISTGLFDSISEKVSKHQTGENNSSAKLRDCDVLKIYSMLGTHSDKEISSMFNVCRSSVNLIRQGKSWKHLYNDYFKPSTTSESVDSSESKWGAS
jgi:hypothetical protein